MTVNWCSYGVSANQFLVQIVWLLSPEIIHLNNFRYLPIDSQSIDRFSYKIILRRIIL
ncbi:hypothetical protein DIR86_000486 [Salmonella enterica subsp. salamae]|nr:hypothetical protein [Salmonella enterica subsp. salamae]